MVKDPSWSHRLEALVDRLGGAPGRYVVSSVILTVLWFPFRLILDRGDPTAAIVAYSALHGMLWGLFPSGAEWMQRRAHGRAGDSARHIDTRTEADRRAWLRRGAFVGLGVGVPFFGALLTLCMSTGRSWAYTLSFALGLLVVVAVALRNLRKTVATVP